MKSTLAGLGLVALAGASPTIEKRITGDFKSQLIDSHNYFRAQHGVGNVTWNDDAAAKAQDWANGCNFSHTGNNPYGQNIAAGTNFFQNWGSFTNYWMTERKDYDYNNPGFSSNTGHFTQIVWKNTNQIGCGYKSCGAGNSATGDFLVCNYNPPGNYGGEFPQNVLRQISGSPTDQWSPGATNPGTGNPGNGNGFTLSVCKDADFNGGCTNISGTVGSCSNIPNNWNDVISSIRGDSKVSCVAYSDGGCQGQTLQIGAGQQMNYVGNSMNDQISSFSC